MSESLQFIRAGLVCAIALPTLANAQFYGDPPDDTHPWAVHDLNRPQPARVEPGATPGAPPSDAIVLFDGTEAALANWEHEKEDRKSDWIVKEGALQCTPGAGYIRSKAQFGDCQLHVEWAAPGNVQGDSQGRGNSGVFLMGLTEVQVLDNFDNPTYADGFAGSVYGVMPPMVNPLHKPGEWQTYDIVFRRPIIRDGKVIDPGTQTVFINGVLVQDATPIEGGGGHKGRSNPLRPFPETGPLKIQDHGNPVRFRNIWYRNIRKRAADGGTDGQLSPEATAAKRAEIATDIRTDAMTMSGKAKMLRLLESLCYEENDAVLEAVGTLEAEFIKDVKDTPKNKMESRKGDVTQVINALKYLVNAKRLPTDYPALGELNGIADDSGWNKRR